jgi:hypothetical protein
MQTYEDRRRHEYWEDRSSLIAGHREAAQSFDKAMLTLSGGALALSLTFIHDIAPQPVAEGWLLAAWIFFGLALIATSSSFLASQYAMHHELVRLDAEFVTNTTNIDEAVRLEARAAAKRKNRLDGLTTILNISSLASFGLGAVCLGWFVWMN